MVDPATALLIATAVSTAAKGAGDYYSSQNSKKSGKRKAKETKRETQASLLDNAFNRGAELEAHKLNSRQKLGKRKSQSFQNTADLVRGALEI